MNQAHARSDFDPIPSIQGAIGSRDGFYARHAKRWIDVAMAIALLPMLAFLILGLALLVALTGGKPFFGHVRIGRDGRAFKCWKIRTMAPDAEARLQALLDANAEAAEQWQLYQKLDRDPRITRIGHFLRRTSLDELPQIWNVLIGDMSFVGPRPVTAPELERYGADRAAYCALRPGITGPWQVSGRSELNFEQRVQIDVSYGRRMNLPLDLMLIARTTLVVFNPTGQ